MASVENTSFFSCISSADLRMFTEWSDMRSKSDIMCRSFVASALSEFDRFWAESFTR